MDQELLRLLNGCAGIRQDPRWHPELDALDHLLQAFCWAQTHTNDGELQAAALLHDVGKAASTEDHANVGADLIEGLMSPRVVWLVRHHMDLLRTPRQTRQRLKGTERLRDLVWLRRCDLAGRSASRAEICPEDAVDLLLSRYEDLGKAEESGLEAPFEPHMTIFNDTFAVSRRGRHYHARREEDRQA